MIQADSYYLKINEPHKSCLLALRRIIKNHNNEITESIKWHIPCFSFRAKHLCFLNINKKTNKVYILFVDGNNLHHKDLEIGDRKQMKTYEINHNQDIDINTINEILEQALELRF